jgi:transcriptional regulator with XRE-family HTH domain
MFTSTLSSKSSSSSEIDASEAAAQSADDLARRTRELGPGIGDRLKQARSDAGLTMDALAKRAHTTITTINTISTGKGGNAGVGTLADIAKALGCSAAWLAFGIGPQADDDVEAIAVAAENLPPAERATLKARLNDLDKPTRSRTANRR